ncbi:hypothetical protein [Hymenobacter sp. DG25A]|uniref:hypothetical protein n=1 Tax=Hymenobacter sp. DG25A TaxID=1385663 RepID=UPI0006BC53E0|nr:hypothetical protein [Hymenobacter sp. DG25A]ALD21623.1 hypothetical protein AM218_10895 [Hymenobacter sp. DG25A]
MNWVNTFIYSGTLLLLGLICLASFLIIRRLFQRYWTQQKHPNLLAVLTTFLAVPLLCAVGLYLALRTYLYYPQRDFTTSGWTSNATKRYEMVKDLQTTHPIIGLTESQVAALLGQPDLKEGKYWAYYIGITPKLGSIDGDALALEFQNAIVVRYLVRQD